MSLPDQPFTVDHISDYDRIWLWRNGLTLLENMCTRYPLRFKRGKLPRPAITISRESGTLAPAIATLVAQELDVVCPGDPPRPWTVFSRNLVTKILEDHSLATRIEEFMPEDVRFPLTESFEYLLGLHPPPGVLREYGKETIRKLAINGNVILVGRGAAVIAAGVPHVLHVRLIAPFPFRAKNFARSHGITNQEAEPMVRAHDVARRRYVRAYLNADVTDPTHYDLVINTGNKSLERVARIISAAVVHLVLPDRGQEGSRPHHPLARNNHAGVLPKNRNDK